MADSQTVQRALADLHDIKPLPTFSSLPAWLLALAAVAAALAALWLARRGKKQQLRAASAPPRPPLETALGEIADIEEKRAKGELGIREFGTSFSTALRRYFENLLAFPALEHTTSEVMQELEGAMRAKLPVFPGEKRKDVLVQAGRALRLCDRATYSDTAESVIAVSSEEISKALETGKGIINALHAAVKSEEQRKLSVVEMTEKR